MNRNILALVSRHMCRYIAIQPHVVSSKVSRYLGRDTIRVSRSHVSRCIDASMHRYTPIQDEIPQKSTTYHNLPPEGTDCAVCSQNWSPNSCAFLCNMFDLYHAQSSRRYFDRKYFNRRMRFLFAKLALCVPPFCREYTHIAPRQNGKMPTAQGKLGE